MTTAAVAAVSQSHQSPNLVAPAGIRAETTAEATLEALGPNLRPRQQVPDLRVRLRLRLRLMLGRREELVFTTFVAPLVRRSILVGRSPFVIAHCHDRN